MELPNIIKSIDNNEKHNIIENFETTNNENEDKLEEERKHIIVYADDNTPTTSHIDPLVLQNNIERETLTVTNWFQKNDMVCSSEKTKLMVIGTASNRRKKITANNIKPEITVCNEKVVENESEKLLGLIINNTMTWRHHFYGNEDNLGLLKELSKRIVERVAMRDKL